MVEVDPILELIIMVDQEQEVLLVRIQGPVVQDQTQMYLPGM